MREIYLDVRGRGRRCSGALASREIGVAKRVAKRIAKRADPAARLASSQGSRDWTPKAETDAGAMVTISATRKCWSERKRQMR
jgi:hypothetical protein